MNISASSGDVTVQLVDTIINSAIDRNASDIHCESVEHGLRIRYRIDGVLYDQQLINGGMQTTVLSRIKILGLLNIAEKRIPQDGKFSIKRRGGIIDLRVSSFPGVFGEKIVVRILDRSHNNIDLDQLGFALSTLAQFHTLITRASGFLLVTGPTGSGKTTTLYAALAEIAAPEKNILTLEDPVEYTLPNITQGQINAEAGFTFEKGIRAMLRQDPDVVMVGEIRDHQTAQIAMQAALTGHLVLSTLHTNDASGAIVRLMDMGIEPFLINAAVTGVLAQRLARKICQSCRYAYEPSVEEATLLKGVGITLNRLYKGKGCSACFNLGYRGRTGIFELLIMNSELRALIIKAPVFETIYDQAVKSGLRSLLLDARQKVEDGIISLDELVRVLL
jgi:type II secretory ATPase GspE/PulE/Tfp pilus assembly ATPase PilB-like protein